MSTKLSSATALHEVRAQSTLLTTGVTKGGPQAELGAKVTANAQSGSDRTLYHVYGFNVVVVANRGKAIPESGPMYQPTGGLAGIADVAVTVPEATGDQTWVYVKVSAVDVVRGTVLALNAGTYSGVAAIAGGAAMRDHMVAGVAQHNIPASNYAWILVEGVGVANVAGAINLELTAAGGAAGGLVVAAAIGKGLGLTLATGAAYLAGTRDAGSVKLAID